MYNSRPSTLSYSHQQSSYSSQPPLNSYHAQFGMPQHQEEASQVSGQTGASKKVKSYCNRLCTSVCIDIPGYFWGSLRDNCLLPVSGRFLSSSIWRTWLVIGNFILLFGNPIQMLLIPAAADPAADVLYTLVFVTFLVDMVFRAIAVAGYFSFSVAAIDKPSRNWLVYAGQFINSIRFPSFLFACDLFSTMTLLADISFTNPSDFKLREIPINLSEVLIPSIQAKDIVNKATPWELNTSLMITVLKTARVVRFVRSQAVSTLISRVNWYWPMQRMNALCNFLSSFCWYGQYYYYDTDDAMDGGDPDGTPQKSPVSGRDRHDPLASSKASNVSGVTLQNAAMAGMGIAAIVAQRRAQEQQNKDKGFVGGMKKFLRGMGLMTQDEPDWQQQLAATKIQSAWRRYLARRHSDRFSDEVNAAGGAGKGTWKNKSIKKNEGAKLLPASIRRMSTFSPGMDKNLARIGQRLKYAAGGDMAAESQVGGAMRELTGQRVAIGILVALLLTATFTYVEEDATRPATMLILHAQTTNTQFVIKHKVSPPHSPSEIPIYDVFTSDPGEAWVNKSLDIARRTNLPDLYRYKAPNREQEYTWPVAEENAKELREREKLKITIVSKDTRDGRELTSVGSFAYRNERKNEALVRLFSTIFILLLWLFGVTAFAGPVMVLVVLPIERMVRLLGMLMVDPLGYQSTSSYRKFVSEEDELTKNTRWTKEVLKGMETSFLMSTILRIGSLMKVGFGSAGVEIIRKNLDSKKGGKLLTSKGLTVSCIFLFCDIRQFTDATECLQEEVFVFTNRIAAVVHSFCHSFGGSANKNVGDAFLCSWLLDAPPNDGFGGDHELYAKSNQADKCLLCVVKIIMALHHDNYYIETMSEAARERLLAKLKKRPGPVVQMGCGMHAGKAVQGAIGSERKIDATYVSEAVEMAEFLESSTKKYGLKMLMSNSFHNLLHSNNRQRCRLVDQIVLPSDEDEDEDDVAMMYERDDIIELYTYDMDVDALWKAPAASQKSAEKVPLDAGSMSDVDSHQGMSDRRRELKKGTSTQRIPGSTRITRGRQRMSVTAKMLSKPNFNTNNLAASQRGQLDGSMHDFGGTEHNSAAMKPTGVSSVDVKEGAPEFRTPELILPTGPAPYNPAYWRSDVMFRIRKKYLDGLHGLFFHNYSQGLQSFYHRDWDRAKQNFEAILECFEDGPSRYFLNIIKKNGGKIPKNFKPYGTA